MYSYEERMRAVRLFVKYDKSCMAVINELGYPSRVQLMSWYREYEKDGDLATRSRARYDDAQKRLAVDHFFDHGQCLARTMRKLGYPKSSELVAQWIEELEPGKRRVRSSPRSFTDEQRAEAVIALQSRSLPAGEIAETVGVTRAVLYKWKNSILGKEAPCKMDFDTNGPADDIDALRRQVKDLQAQIKALELKRAVLEGTVELLGKDRSVDPNMLTNKEKALLANSLRPAHRLKDILTELGMPRSSYQYQVEAQGSPDKYGDLRRRVEEIFSANDGRYGYRRIHIDLRNEGIRVSEKVVARLMREQGLTAKRGKRRKYSSYKGELSAAPENLVKRVFHADAPNKLWLTDITEFRIPADKVYLSPIVDCFDGLVVSWTMSTSPNAELANSMLDEAAAKLGPGEHPTVHSDRGCHYRWPGWIERCEKYGITRSMSKKGCSPDNSAMEGCFGRLKVEMFYGGRWSGWTIEEFMGAVDDYIHRYNEKRIKASLGGLSPLQYRRSLGLAA